MAPYVLLHIRRLKIFYIFFAAHLHHVIEKVKEGIPPKRAIATSCKYFIELHAVGVYHAERAQIHPNLPQISWD